MGVGVASFGWELRVCCGFRVQLQHETCKQRRPNTDPQKQSAGIEDATLAGQAGHSEFGCESGSELCVVLMRLALFGWWESLFPQFCDGIMQFLKLEEPECAVSIGLKILTGSCWALRSEFWRALRLQHLHLRDMVSFRSHP